MIEARQLPERGALGQLGETSGEEVHMRGLPCGEFPATSRTQRRRVGARIDCTITRVDVMPIREHEVKMQNGPLRLSQTDIERSTRPVEENKKWASFSSDRWH